jgi:endonuclease/exonuclease/phosphatase (EEP) superfamily protein YafD
MTATARSRARRAETFRRRPPRLARWFFGGRLTGLDIVGVALGGLSALAVVALGGAFSGLLDVLNLFQPLFLVAALGLIAVSAVKGPRALPILRWPLLGLGGVGALAAGGMVLPDVAARWTQAPPPAHPALTLRVLTQNVWERNHEIGATAYGIRKSGADVVLLQELDGPMRDLPKALAADYPYQADCTRETEWCSMAILSKRPILKWSHHDPAWRPPEWDRLSLLRATIDGGSAGPVELITTHLMHPDHAGPASQQAGELLRAVADADTGRAIIAGDFNRAPSSFALRRIDRGMPIPRQSHGVASWPNRLPWGEGRSRWPFPFLAIDQVYAGRDWRTVSIVRAPSTGSDHYGLVATLALKPLALKP